MFFLWGWIRIYQGKQFEQMILFYQYKHQNHGITFIINNKNNKKSIFNKIIIPVII